MKSVAYFAALALTYVVTFSFSSIVQAATFTPADCVPGNIHFCVTEDAKTPDVDDYLTAFITNTFSKTTSVDDTYKFTFNRDGLASAGLQTSYSSPRTLLSVTDVIINGVSFASSIVRTSAGSSLNVNNIEITRGVQNTIRVIGFFSAPKLGGRSNYTGNLTFTAAVPEASTWAMMILGIGAIGLGMRRRAAGPARGPRRRALRTSRR